MPRDMKSSNHPTVRSGGFTLIEGMVAMTVLASVMLHGITAAPAAKRYGEYATTGDDREVLYGMDVPDMATKKSYGIGEMDMTPDWLPDVGPSSEAEAHDEEQQ